MAFGCTISSNSVLTVLKEAVRLAPIPYLQDAAGLALEIVSTIQVRSLSFHGALGI
jgi:hypothetical protein